MHRVNTMIDIQEAFISEFHTTLYKSYWKQQFTQTEKYLSFWLMQQTLHHCDIWSFLDGIPNLILHYCCRTSTLINMKISRDHYTYSEYETQTLPHSLGIFLCSVMLFFFQHYQPSEECYMFQTAEVSFLIFWLFMAFNSIHNFVLMY